MADTDTNTGTGNAGTGDKAPGVTNADAGKEASGTAPAGGKADAGKDKSGSDKTDPYAGDIEWVAKLGAADQNAYFQGRQTWDTAKQTYGQAAATADAGVKKVKDDFDTLKSKYKDAKTALDAAVKAAVAADSALGKSLSALSGATDPDDIKADVLDVQTKAAGIGPAVTAVGAAAGPVDAARTALVAAAEPQSKFDIGTIHVDDDTLAVAKAEADLAKSKAKRTFDTATQKFEGLRKTLKAKVPKAA